MKGTVAFLVVVNCALAAALGAYDYSAFHGVLPMSKPIFIGLLSIVFAFNFISILFLAYRWKSRSMTAKVLLTLFGWDMFWGYVFCSIYLLLVVNMDVHQQEVALLLFAWQVPIIGGLFVAISYLLFKPLTAYLTERPNDLSREQYLKLYTRAARFPLYMSVLIFLTSVFGFGIATFQMRLFADLPVIEAIKNYLVGFVAATYFTLVYYVVVRQIINPIYSELQEKSGAEIRKGSSIARRVILATIILFISSLLLLQLIVVTSFQHLVRAEVYATLSQDIQSQKWDEGILTQGQVLTNPTPTVLSNSHVNDVTQIYIRTHTSGIIDDYQSTIKLVAFYTDPVTHSKSVIIVPLEAYYGPLAQSIYFFSLSALLVLFIGLGIAWLATGSVTKSLQQLTEALRTLDTDPSAPIPHIASGDEVEDLSEALGFFVRRSQRIDQEKSEFISIASHNLRTPLTELRWAVKAVEQGNPKENITQLLPVIHTAVEHMSELVKTLLDNNRFSTDGVAVSISAVDLKTLFADLQRKFEELAREKNITLVFENPPAVVLQTDQAFLSAILEPLLSNAIQYTKENGKVTFAAHQDGEEIEFTCADTGIGIPAEDQEKIFEKFNRASNAQSMRPDGTGLGLYLAKQAAKRLGGSISFTSNDSGTTFTVRLPIVFKEPKIG